MQQPLLDAIFPEVGGRKIITIDGPAGSGKTTLAAELSARIRSTGFSVEVIHMDDLYNGWKRALSEDLTHSLISIVDGFEKGEVTFEIFNWILGKFSGSKTFPSPQVLILEGVGSGQSAIRSNSNLAIWIEVEPDVAFNRVIARDGEEIRIFLKQWVVDQAAHFFREETRGAADYQLIGAP